LTPRPSANLSRESRIGGRTEHSSLLPRAFLKSWSGVSGGRQACVGNETDGPAAIQQTPFRKFTAAHSLYMRSSRVTVFTATALRHKQCTRQRTHGQVRSTAVIRRRKSRSVLYTQFHCLTQNSVSNAVKTSQYRPAGSTQKCGHLRCVFQELPEPNRACLVGVW